MNWDDLGWPSDIPAGGAGREELEQLHLAALEAVLADARRLLAHAGGIRAPHRHRREVLALAALAGELHHAVLEAMYGRAGGSRP